MTTPNKEHLNNMSESGLINEMAKVMANSISKLLQPCIEQRCKQFLSLMNSGGMFAEPVNDKDFKREDPVCGD